MASGVTAADDCKATFQKLKLGKGLPEERLKYVMFNLNKDSTQIVVDKTSTSTEYDDFIADLPEAECRWAVYDFHFEKEDGGKRNKLCFLSWSPDTARIKQKMLFASSKEALRRSLDGISIEIQATAYDEASYESLLDKANRGN